MDGWYPNRALAGRIHSSINLGVVRTMGACDVDSRHCLSCSKPATLPPLPQASSPRLSPTLIIQH